MAEKDFNSKDNESDDSSETQSNHQETKDSFEDIILSPLPESDPQLYCVCRKPDDGSFMIQCDGCEEWFHGLCVGINPKDGAKLDSYMCPPCSGETWDSFKLKNLKKQQQIPKRKYSETESESDIHEKPTPPSMLNRMRKNLNRISTKPKFPQIDSIQQKQDTIRSMAKRGFENTFKAILEDMKMKLGETKLNPELYDPKRLAEKLEQEMFESFALSNVNGILECGTTYKGKYRSLQFNLKDKKNLKLRESILNGEMKPASLIRLSSEELGNEDIKAAADSIQQSSLKTVFKPLSNEAPIYKKPISVEASIEKKVISEIRVPIAAVKKTSESLDEILAKMGRYSSTPDDKFKVEDVPYYYNDNIGTFDKQLEPVIDPNADIWKGRVNFSLGSCKFNGTARQVCGRSVGDIKAWEDILPAAISIDGRISSSSVGSYLEVIKGQKDLAVVQFIPETNDEDKSGYDSVFRYFSTRGRYGVVPQHYVSVKDMYIIPLGKEEQVPEFIMNIADCTIETSSRSEDLLLAVLIRTTNKKDKRVQRKDVVSSIPATYVPQQTYQSISNATTNGLLASLISGSSQTPIAPAMDISQLMAQLKDQGIIKNTL